jgi:mono/diheme cytochrome c family protein
LSVVTMTFAAYASDRSDGHARKQLARQAAEEASWRQQPFNPQLLGGQQRGQPSSGSTSGPNAGQPAKYVEFCANCHGLRGEGGRQGVFTFPPLLDVAAKPRRTATDIVALLKNPAAFGLQPPMRSFADKLSDAEMKEIAEWVVQLKR